MSITAPDAPGRLGVPLDPAQAGRYISDLQAWIDARRSELDQIDQVVMASPDRDQLTGDVALCLTLWKSVSDRHDLLVATWDSGRVGPVERERLSSLIWGRLETGDPKASALAVSLPEASRLCDAMVAQLRTRVSFDVNAHQYAGRMHDLRAQMSRLQDQVALEPPALRAEPAAKLADLQQRVDAMTDRMAQGGDIGGLIGPVEIEAATFERDLIVGGVQRRRARGLIDQTREKLDDLIEREEAMRKLVKRCLATVSPSPKYAVPDVDVLGPMPNTPDRVKEFSERLDKVSRAMQVVQEAYTEALHEHDLLTARAEQLRDRARTLGLTENRDVAGVSAICHDVLSRRPCPMPLARHLIATYEAALEWALTQQRTPTREGEPT